MTEPRAAFYSARPGGWRDWWTLLHPPYTAWHLSYVAIGAALAPRFNGVRLGATVLAFFAAVGVAAHAIDEWRDRPLRTHISDRSLMAAAVLGLGAAVGLGVLGTLRVGIVLVPFIVVGPALVIAYNAEVLGGLIHTDAGFAVAWGAFPLLTAYVAQGGGWGWSAGFGAAGAFAISYAQRTLSTPARLLRRRAAGVSGSIEILGSPSVPVDRASLLAPLERALLALSWGMVALAAGAVLARL